MNTRYENDAKVKVKTHGSIELIAQRVEAAPGATFGWHSHPGENINVVKQGAITIYHDEECSAGTTYGPGVLFTTSPDTNPARLALHDPQVARELEIAAANLLDEALDVVAQIGRGFTQKRDLSNSPWDESRTANSPVWRPAPPPPEPA